jgi:hypothetical protein
MTHGKAESLLPKRPFIDENGIKRWRPTWANQWDSKPMEDQETPLLEHGLKKELQSQEKTISNLSYERDRYKKALEHIRDYADGWPVGLATAVLKPKENPWTQPTGPQDQPLIASSATDAST